MTKTYVQELEADIEMTKEIVNSYKVDIIASVKDIFNRYLANDTDAMITKTDLRLGISNAIELVCEIGFWNDQENRIDFGSDVMLDFTLRDGLRINHGIMGYASKKDIYQMKRYNLFGYFYKNYDMMETELTQVVNNANAWQEASISILEKETKIKDYLEAEAEEYRKTLNAQLAVGDLYKHATGILARHRIWNYSYNYDADVFEVVKLTPKYVTLKALLEGVTELHIKRDTLVRAVAESKVVKIGK